MFCAKCGNQLNDNAKFCGACGNPVKSKKIEVVPEPELVLDEISKENDQTAFLLDSEPVPDKDDQTVVLHGSASVPEEKDRTFILPRNNFTPDLEPVPVDLMPEMMDDLPENDSNYQFVPSVEDIGGYHQSSPQPEQKKSKTTGILITVLIFLILASLAAGGFFLQKSGTVDFLAMVGLGEKEEKTDENESPESSEDNEDSKDDNGDNGDNDQDGVEKNDDQTVAGDTAVEAPASEQQVVADSALPDAAPADSSSENAIDIASLTTDPQEMDAYEMFYYFHGSFIESGKSPQDLSAELCEFSSGKDDERFLYMYVANKEYLYSQVVGYDKKTILFDDLNDPSMIIRYLDPNVIEITMGDEVKTYERADLGIKARLSDFEGSYVISNSAEIDAAHPQKLVIYSFTGDFSDVCVDAGGAKYTFADFVKGQAADDFYLVGAEKIHTVKKTDNGIKYAGVEYAK